MESDLYDCCHRGLLRPPRVPGEDGRRSLHGPTTNLCKEIVAEPGMCLHFNFQAVCILWAFTMAMVSICFYVRVDNDLLALELEEIWDSSGELYIGSMR